MIKALICCRAGIGSSMMLKIKTNQVIKENGYDIEVEHANLDSVPGFNGELIITLSDVAQELSRKNLKPTVIGINNVMDKDEINNKLSEYLNTQK